MDIHETIERICTSDDVTLGKASMNSVADQYRNGEDLRTLIPLLTSLRPRVVQCGAWIASEVADKKRGREIFDELSQLLCHPDDEVRFWSIEGVAMLATPADTTVLHQFIELLIDESRPVRLWALRWLCIIPESTIQGLKNTDLWHISALLMNGTGKPEIMTQISGCDRLGRRIALAAAMRNFGTDDTFIEGLSRFLDDEEISQLPHLPKCIR